MASEQEQLGYRADAEEVAADLMEAGFQASFGKESDRVNHGLPGEYEELCKEYVLEVEGKQIFSDTVMAGDSVYMVGNETGMIPACKNMKTTAGIRKIFERKPFLPDGETLIFTWVLVRE